MDQATQVMCVNWARKTLKLVPADGHIPSDSAQYSYDEVMTMLERQRELIAERIERGR